MRTARGQQQTMYLKGLCGGVGCEDGSMVGTAVVQTSLFSSSMGRNVCLLFSTFVLETGSFLEYRNTRQGFERTMTAIETNVRLKEPVSPLCSQDVKINIP